MTAHCSEVTRQELSDQVLIPQYFHMCTLFPFLKKTSLECDVLFTLLMVCNFCRNQECCEIPLVIVVTESKLYTAFLVPDRRTKDVLQFEYFRCYPSLVL